MPKFSRDKVIVSGPSVQWRLCVGLPDYMVSEYGDVMRITKGRTREAGHQPVGDVNADGYRMFKLISPGGEKVRIAAHRLVAFAFHGAPPTDGHQVAHADGNPANNHYTNLRWATVAENAADKVAHGRSSRGTRNVKARLDPERVRAIRRLHQGGVSGYRIASQMGLGETTVYQVLSGKTWSHVR